MVQTPIDQLPQGDHKRQAVQQMFDTIAPRYDLINRIMTLRMDVGWRKKTMASLRLAPNALVLDLASGTGDFAVALEKLGHHPIGIDLSYGMLDAAQSAHVRVQGDVLSLPIADGTIDAAVCGFALRNLVALPPFFAELHRVVRPGGRIALVDVSTPDNRVMAWGHGLYFNRVVPKIGGLLSDRSAYAYLPRSVSYLPAPGIMIDQLSAAGFDEVERHQLGGGIAQLLCGTRRSTA